MAWAAIGQLAGGAGSGAVWTTGSGSPVTPGVNAGDMYLNVTNGDVYRWNGVAWTLSGNIKGATGSTGPTGGTGPTGPTGATGGQGPTGGPGLPNIGPVGPRGSDGSKWLIGASDPKPTDGVLGDFYFKTVNNPNGPIVLKGDPGPPGQQGIQGQPGSSLNKIARVNIGTNQSIGNNAVTAVQWSGVDVDSLNAFSAANNTRLTAKSSGWYLVGGSSHWPATTNQGTTRVLDFRINGSTVVYTQSGIPGESAVNDMRQSGTAMVYMANGDYVEMVVYQDDGGSVSLLAPIYFWLINLGG